MKRSRMPMALSRPGPGTRSVSSSPAADPSLPPRLHTQEPALNVPQVLQPACGNARTSSRRLRRSVSRGVVREGRPDFAAEKAARRASVAPTMRTPKSPRPTPSATSIKRADRARKVMRKRRPLEPGSICCTSARFDGRPTLVGHPGNEFCVRSKCEQAHVEAQGEDDEVGSPCRAGKVLPAGAGRAPAHPALAAPELRDASPFGSKAADTSRACRRAK